MKSYNVQAVRHITWVERTNHRSHVQVPQFDVPASSLDECKTKLDEILAVIYSADIGVKYTGTITDGDEVWTYESR